MADSVSKAKTGFKFIWTVENMFPCADSRTMISPPFVVRALNKTKWKLEFIMHCKSKSTRLRLHRMDGGPKSIECNAEVEILSSRTPMIMDFFKNGHFTVGAFLVGSFTGNQDLQESLAPNGELKLCIRMWASDQQEIEKELCFARTRIGLDRRSFMWSEQSFNSANSCKKRTLTWQPDSKSTLILSLCLQSKKNTEEVSMETLFEKRSSNSPVLLIICLAIVDASGVIVHAEKQQEHWFYKNNQFWQFPLSLKKNILMDKKQGFLVGDALHLKCDCFLYSGRMDTQLEEYTKLNFSGKAESVICGSDNLGPVGPDEKSVCFYNWQKDIESLCNDNLLCGFDVYLQVDTMSFPTHKVILGARSVVFKNIFMTGMQRKLGKIVKISDLDANTVRRMLEFVYTGAVEDLNVEVATELYYAADKYEMKSMKQMCSQFVKSTLNLENACEILTLANKHSDEDLKRSVKSFIMEHDSLIRESESWKNFVKGNNALALVMMEGLYKNTRTNSASTSEVP